MMKKQVIRGLIVGGIALGLGGTTFATVNYNATPKLKEYALKIEAGTSTNTLLKELKNNSSDVDQITLASTYENSKLGNQNITVDLANKRNKTRTANVALQIVDTTAPVIHADKQYTVNYDTPFDLASTIKVTDNATLKPTVKISDYTKKVGKQEVSIVAVDDSNNTATKEITLHFVDTTAPKITGENVTIEQGTDYNLLEGVTASDNADGDLTKKITTSGDFDAKTAGSYTVLYSVTDASGNESQWNRTLTVTAPVIQKVASAPTSVSYSENTGAATNQPMTMTILGTTLSYQNGGQAAGQSIIDANPNYGISTWGGAGVQSSTDGMNTHFIGHNPGAFSVLFSLSGGNLISVTDGNGQTANYQVTNIFQVNDSAIGMADGVDYWDTITGTGGGERITLQTCVNDSVNLIVIATLV